ncbi:uncharacterized protein TNCV_4571 [Trichonephila clavipes]|nr:uncharacterized protein TNCV_4571 [Trichonephila clavipes]
MKQKVMTGQGDEFKFQAPYSKPSIKLSTYEGKSSWQVYMTQFSIVADANQWDSQTKACQLAASLRADAADILQTCRKHSGWISTLSFTACSGVTVLCSGVRDPEIQKALRMADLKDLKGGPSVCYEIRGSPASNTKGQTPPYEPSTNRTRRTQVWSG